MTLTKNLKKRYVEDVVPALKEKYNYQNVHQIPKLDKIVINMGVGEAVQNAKILDGAVEELTKIAGQRPVVTLRGEKMYDFLTKLINVTLPRIRDFRGVSAKSFDGRGNYSLGIKEQLLFPEIKYDDVSVVKGMNISIITTANTDDEARELLAQLGMPFKKK